MPLKNSFLALLISCPLFAYASSHLEIKLAKFNPSDSLFCQIYGHSQTSYEVEFGHQLTPQYELWLNAGLVSKEGKTHFLGDSTHCYSYNISGGGKYLLPYNSNTFFYVGLGASVAHLHLHNNSDYVRRSVYKNSLGVVFKSGMYWLHLEPLVVDLFVDYLYQPIHFEQTRQLGGLKMGVGLGVQF